MISPSITLISHYRNKYEDYKVPGKYSYKRVPLEYMNVFISWSKERSGHVARALAKWLPSVIQTPIYWMSQNDINAGTRWYLEINSRLSNTDFGIICVTKENQHEPWLMFEAGALAKTISDRTFVIPYLIDMDLGDLRLPLSEFHAVPANEQGTFEMIKSINVALRRNQEKYLTEEHLSAVYLDCYKRLEESLDSLPELTGDQEQDQHPEDATLAKVSNMIEELLVRQRRIGLSSSYSNIKQSSSTSDRLVEEGETFSVYGEFGKVSLFAEMLLRYMDHSNDPTWDGVPRPNHRYIFGFENYSDPMTEQQIQKYAERAGVTVAFDGGITDNYTYP